MQVRNSNSSPGSQEHRSSAQMQTWQASSALPLQCLRTVSIAVLVPLLLALLPYPASAQLPFPPCSSCTSCDLTSCTGCAKILNNTCPTNAGWCYGCSNCTGTSCNTCNTIGFQLGCADVAVEQRTRDFIAFLFLAFLVVIVAWVGFTMWRRQRQRRAQQMAQAGDMALQDLHNPTYAHPHPSTGFDAYGNSVPVSHPGGAPAAHVNPSNANGRPEPYSYYYASTASMGSSPALPLVPPSYPAAPPGYPGFEARPGQYPQAGDGTGQPYSYPNIPSHTAGAAGSAGGGDGAGAFPLPTSTNAAANMPFSSSDQLTPLPGTGAESPTAVSGSAGRRRVGQGQDQRQSLLSEEQRAANSSSL